MENSLQCNDGIKNSLEDLKTNCEKWTLNSDLKLLSHLKQFSNDLINKTENADKSINNLVFDANINCVKVNNVINEFQMLANSQFVENRVYDEEFDDISANGVNSIQNESQIDAKLREEDIVPKIKCALDIGLNFLSDSFNNVSTLMPQIDSEEEEEDVINGFIANASKDEFSQRLLPYIIGSEDFIRDNFVGLKLTEDENPIIDLNTSKIVNYISAKDDDNDSYNDDLLNNIETTSSNKTMSNGNIFLNSDNETEDNNIFGVSSRYRDSDKNVNQSIDSDDDNDLFGFSSQNIEKLDENHDSRSDNVFDSSQISPKNQPIADKDLLKRPILSFHDELSNVIAGKKNPRTQVINGSKEVENEIVSPKLEITARQSTLKPEITVRQSTLKPEITVRQSTLKPEITARKSTLKPEITVRQSTSKPIIPVRQSAPKPKMSVHLSSDSSDDDSIFKISANKSKQQLKTNSNTNNSLFDDIKHDEIKKVPKTEISRQTEKRTVSISSSNSSDDDSIFKIIANKSEQQLKTNSNSNNSKFDDIKHDVIKKVPKTEKRTVSISSSYSSDDDSIFKIIANKSKQQLKTNSNNSIFDDIKHDEIKKIPKTEVSRQTEKRTVSIYSSDSSDDDSIFKIIANKSKQQLKTNSNNSIFDDIKHDEIKKVPKTEVSRQTEKRTVSISSSYSSDDDSIFKISANKSEQQLKTNSTTNNSSVFDDIKHDEIKKVPKTEISRQTEKRTVSIYSSDNSDDDSIFKISANKSKQQLKTNSNKNNSLFDDIKYEEIKNVAKTEISRQTEKQTNSISSIQSSKISITKSNLFDEEDDDDDDDLFSGLKFKKSNPKPKPVDTSVKASVSNPFESEKINNNVNLFNDNDEDNDDLFSDINVKKKTLKNVLHY